GEAVEQGLGRTEVSGTRRALTHAIHRHLAIISQIGDHLGVVLLMNTSSRHRARAPLLAKHAPDVSHSKRRRTRVPKTRNPPRSRVFVSVHLRPRSTSRAVGGSMPRRALQVCPT